MKVYEYRKIIAGILFSLSGFLFAENLYEVVSTNVAGNVAAEKRDRQKKGASLGNLDKIKPISEKSTQLEVNQTCAFQKNYAISTLKAAKADHPDRAAVIQRIKGRDLANITKAIDAPSGNNTLLQALIKDIIFAKNAAPQSGDRVKFIRKIEVDVKGLIPQSESKVTLDAIKADLKFLIEKPANNLLLNRIEKNTNTLIDQYNIKILINRLNNSFTELKKIETPTPERKAILNDIESKINLLKSSATKPTVNAIKNALKTLEKTASREVISIDRGKLDSACAVLSNPKSRYDYDQKLKKDRLDAQERFNKEAKEKYKEGKGEKPKEEAPPSPSSSNFIGKLKSFVQGKIDGLKKDADAKIINLVGDALSKIPIPPVGLKIFNNELALKNVKFYPAPKSGDIRTGLGITGTTQFNKFAVQATVFVVQDKNKQIQYSVGIGLPDNYKISSLFPKFKKLDAIPIPQGMLVASTFDYTMPDAYSVQSADAGSVSIGSAGGMKSVGLQKGGFTVQKGFNFIGAMSLEGPLKVFGELRKKAKQFDSIVVDFDTPIYLQGIIASMNEAKFLGVIPLRLGMDFQKLKKIPKGFTDIFNKITTDDFIIDVTMSPTEQKIGGQTGIRVYLGTQDGPVRIQGFGTVDILTGKWNFGGKIPDMIELVWLAIGEFGLELYLDPGVEAILALLGIPVSGIGVKGRIDLAKKGDTRASMSVAGKLSLETKKAADFALDVKASNLQFAELVSLLTKMAAKAGVGNEIPSSKIPTMTISNLTGRLAPYDTEIAGTKIAAGFQMAMDAQLFNKKFGFDVDIRHKDLTFSGNGYMSEIALKAGKKTIMKLSGPGPDKVYGTKDDGPIVACNFNAKKPLDGRFAISTMLDVPPLGLKNSVDFEVSAKKFKVDFEASYAGFTTIFGVNLNPKELKETYFKFGFKGDFEKFLSQQAKPALESLKKEATEKLAEVDKKIGQLAGELDKLRKEQTKLRDSGSKATQAEINKTRATMRRIENKIAALKRECKDASIIKKAIVCPKVGAQIATQGTALLAQKTYLEGLLKPGKQVIKGAMNTLNKINEASQKASKALSEAKLFQKTARGILTGITKALDGVAKGLNIFKVSEAIGGISAQDMYNGKIPLIQSFKAEVNIPDLAKVNVNLSGVQFDFNKPKQSAIELAKKLVSSVKISR